MVAGFAVPLEVEGATADWYPLPTVRPGSNAVISAGQVVAATDSERAYIVMMTRLLPVGLLGLVAASLIAAFMSTIDTHVNLAASFFLNDVYRRFYRPDADPKHYVLVARLASVVVLVIGALFASQSDSVRSLFVFFMAFLGGVGPVYVLRWLWWRIRASTEITAMVTSAIVSTTVTHMRPGATGLLGIDFTWSLGVLSVGGELTSVGRILIVTAISIVAALLSLLATRTPDPASLVDFYRRTRPLGAWGPVRALAPDAGPRSEALPALIGILGGIALVYGLMLGLGFLFLERNALLATSAGVALAGTFALRWALDRVSAEEEPR